MKEKKQKKIIHEIDLDENLLKEGKSHPRGSTPAVHGYKLVKKSGMDIEDFQNSQKFDPVIAMHKLKNFLSKDSKDIKADGFKIPETPCRELLSNKMVEEAEVKKRRQQKAKRKRMQETLDRVTGTPSRSKNKDKYEGLSDAAKRLASSSRGGSSIRQMGILSGSSKRAKNSNRPTPKLYKR